jgi:hypothetical protein
MKNTLMKLFALSTLGLAMAGCAPYKYSSPPTPADIQHMQSMTTVAGKDQTFNGAITAMQNLGYIIKRKNKAAGTVTVIGSTKSTSAPGRTVNNKVCHGKGDNQKCRAVTTQEPATSATTRDYGTITISPDTPIKSITSIRLNFRVKKTTSGQHGQSGETDAQITDPAFYQNIFNQITNSTSM